MKPDFLGSRNQCDSDLAKAALGLVDDNGNIIGAGQGGPSAPGGRLTTESGVPISTTDRVAQGTIYYTPFIHNNIRVWDGSAWQVKTFAEIPLVLTITNGKNYDVFIDSTATTLSLSNAWTNDTTRADALASQDGVTVLSSDHAKLWLGTIRASGTNVTADSAGGSVAQVGGKRFVWNAYNQVSRTMSVKDTSINQWNYGIGTIRQANAAAGNKVEYVTGFAGDVISASVLGAIALASNTVVAYIGIGLDSTTSFIGAINTNFNGTASVIFCCGSGQYIGSPGLGYHYVSWNEQGADGTCAFTGTATSGASALLQVLLNN